MPVLDPSHDRAHPVEGDGAWSESYYFNCYDPDADVGFYSRVGVRPNEGTIDVGLSVWLPGGGIDHLGWRREQKEMIDSVPTDQRRQRVAGHVHRDRARARVTVGR